MGSVTATQRRQKAQWQRNGDGNSNDCNDRDDGNDGDEGDDDSDGNGDDGNGNGWQWIPRRRRDGVVVNPPMQSSRRIVAVRLRVRLPLSCHQHADSAPAYAVESRQAINPLPGPASSLLSLSRTAASLSLAPPTSNHVFRLPPEGPPTNGHQGTFSKHWP